MDLVEILKDVPERTKLWSVVHGEVELVSVKEDQKHSYPIVCEPLNSTCCLQALFSVDGRLDKCYKDGECVLFPSKECRDWNQFQRPKFNPKELKAFDAVLVRNSKDEKWFATFFSHIDGEFSPNSNNAYVASFTYWDYCIPYNKETKHLVGTKNDPPLFYRV